MSRIRSVHPGIWTDERFVSVSMAARLFFIGIWNECDDQGFFDWSPLKLKMRLMPADAVDAAELLAELAEAGAIMRYEAAGKSYGAVRNFAKYQRPKKPNSVHPGSEQAIAFTGCGSEAMGEELPTGGEKSPQMEEGGGRRKEEREVVDAGKPAPSYAFSGRIVRLVETDLARWRKTYHSIADLNAELTVIDGWWAKQPAEKQKGWFQATQGMLNKKHQANLEARARGEKLNEWMSPC